MTQRIKATVRYDGGNFAGWQVQPGERTVQGAIEDELATMANRPVRIHGAGRTDAGAHALGQVFHCDWGGAKTLPQLRRSLSQMLAPDIRVEAIEEAPDGFHARYDAASKRYAYVFCTDREPDPFSARYAWQFGRPVDPQYVEDLAQRLTGTHDFAGFCASGSSVEDTVRTLREIVALPGPLIGPCDGDNHWRLEFEGTGFLYKMVRNIVGTLVDVAREKRPAEDIDALLNAPGPFEGSTAPASGLFLMRVTYDRASPTER